MVEHKSAPIGSILEDFDHRGYKPDNWVDMVAGNQDTGFDNQDTDSEYTWVPIEQCNDFAVEYKYSLAVEGNNQNLEAGCKLVETDLEGNSHLGVERAASK